MASTYVNNLRLEEMATGEKSGTWGTISNTNLELLGQAWGSGTESFASDADTTVTMSDGSSDDARSFFLDVTSGVSLTTTRTMTLAPNTVNKVWIIKNSTSGSQSINISQGSGSNVTIANGATVMIYTDGAGSGAAVTQVDLIGGGGGTLTGNLNFNDSVKAQFGNSQDLQIYHDASNSYIVDSGTGNLQIAGTTNVNIQKGDLSEYMAKFIADGAVELYYDSSKKLETTSGGVTVTGTVTADGVSLGDNEKAQFGASNDLQIYHDGSTSFIDDAGTGNLVVKTNGGGILLLSGAENLAKFVSDGASELYYDNVKKFETTSRGIDISGTAVADTNTASKAAGTHQPDMATYQNFVWTLTGNITLSNQSADYIGQTGFLVFIQDGTGGRTVSLGAAYETVGGAGLTLSSAGGSTDIVPYVYVASGRILLGTPQLAFS